MYLATYSWAPRARTTARKEADAHDLARGCPRPDGDPAAEISPKSSRDPRPVTNNFSGRHGPASRGIGIIITSAAQHAQGQTPSHDLLHTPFPSARPFRAPRAVLAHPIAREAVQSQLEYHVVRVKRPFDRFDRGPYGRIRRRRGVCVQGYGQREWAWRLAVGQAGERLVRRKECPRVVVDR